MMPYEVGKTFIITLRFLYEVTNMNYSNVFAIQSFCMSSQYKIFPRIKYGKIVLSPAKWYISIEDLTKTLGWVYLMKKFLMIKFKKLCLMLRLIVH